MPQPSLFTRGITDRRRNDPLSLIPGGFVPIPNWYRHTDDITDGTPIATHEIEGSSSPVLTYTTAAGSTYLNINTVGTADGNWANLNYGAGATDTKGFAVPNFVYAPTGSNELAVLGGMFTIFGTNAYKCNWFYGFSPQTTGGDATVNPDSFGFYRDVNGLYFAHNKAGVLNRTLLPATPPSSASQRYFLAFSFNYKTGEILWRFGMGTSATPPTYQSGRLVNTTWARAAGSTFMRPTLSLHITTEQTGVKQGRLDSVTIGHKTFR